MLPPIITWKSADSGSSNDYMLPLIITCNSADSGSLNDMLQLNITCNSADSGPLNDYMLPLIITCNSAHSWPYITIMNDYSVPLNTMSADCGPFNDYISPLCLISNSAHLELCSNPWTTFPLISRIITLWWSFLLFPIGTVNVSVRDLLTVFVPYFKDFDP